MLIHPDTFSLDNFVKDRGMTDLELEILKTYFDLPEDIRSTVIDRFKQTLSTSKDNETVEQKQEEYPDIEEELASYRQELLAEKKGTTLSVFDDTSMPEKGAKQRRAIT